MTLPKHLDQAVAELEAAGARIETAREEPLSLASVQAWLAALTDFAAALSEIQRFNNESVHEKLHQLADRVGLKSFPGEPARPPRG